MAALPIVVLFLMLGVLRKPAWVSAATALASALLVSLIVYGMPIGLALTTPRPPDPPMVKAATLRKNTPR